MKRNKFILSIVAMATVPFTTMAHSRNNGGRTNKGFKVNAGEGRIHGHLKMQGVNANILDLKVSGSDTDGGFAMFEQTSVSPGKGTPLHVHHLQDEVFYVVEGSYYFQVGKDKFLLTKGECIFLPMKVAHAWTQVSEQGKMTVLIQPAGKLEAFFVTVAALKQEPTKGEIAKIFADHEMTIVGPPLEIE